MDVTYLLICMIIEVNYMVYIITKSTYPSHKVNEVAQKYLEGLQKFPADESLGQLLVTAVKTTEKGISGLSVFEVKEGKMAEAMDLIIRTTALSLEIDGYEVTTDIFYNVAEAFDVIGMKLPE